MTLTQGPAASKIAVVIPSFRVKGTVLSVIERIGSEVCRIYVVDDKCPEQSGSEVQNRCTDPRVRVIFHDVNQGVGGAVMSGYKAGIDEGMDIIVKIDGDGQMDPALLPQLAAPILASEADYSKGNRFFSPECLEGMPPARIIGNAGLSFLTKLSSGYWDVLDPTNGYTAIHRSVAEVLPLHKIEKRYFFESDMLFRLNTVRAVVADIPMLSHYADEESNLHAMREILPFLRKNIRNYLKRIVYSYVVRGFSFATFCLIFGIVLSLFGAVVGTHTWLTSVVTNVAATPGTVMLAVVPLIMGFQLALAFAAADISSTPRQTLHTRLKTAPARPLVPFDHQELVRGPV